MQNHLNKRQQFFAVLAIILIIVEYCIARYLKSGFIRTVVGDLFIALLVYAVIRAFTAIHPIRLGIYVWIFTFLVEISQWLQIVELLGMPRNEYTTMVFGHAFDWRDIIAYTLGTAIVVFLDVQMISNANSNSSSQT